MNLNDKNIDQIFRDAAQNTDAPRYDHSYWKEMSSILNDQDKRKRGVILWSVAGSVIALFLVSTLFITNNKKSEAQLAKNDQSFTQANEIIVGGTSIDENSSPKNAYKKTNAQSVSNEVSDTDVTLENESVVNNESSRNFSISNNHSSVRNSDSNSKVESSASDIASNKGSQRTANNLSSERTENNPVNSSSDKLLEEKTSRSEELPIASKTDENSSEVNDKLYIQGLSPKVVSMQSFETGNELLPIQLLNDSPFNFYARLSAGLMENYETSRPFQSGVFDLSLNLEYTKEQVLFRTGIGFQATSNADLVVSERAKVYGFGITTHQNNLSYQSLYDIYIPLELGYKLNNTSFGFGAQINYMLGTTMNYESLENKVVVDEYKLKGFAEGLNAMTAQGYIWLEQKLTDRISAGVKVGTNLNSRIKEGKYFNESATTNPLYGQLTLRYNFNK